MDREKLRDLGNPMSPEDLTDHGGIVEGFSSWSRKEKIEWLRSQGRISDQGVELLYSHLHPDPGLQEAYASFSENHLSDYHLPLGLAPNFLVNGRFYTLPMVTEESSVVAAAAKAAKFWARHGGFRAEVVGTRRVGQVHFLWRGSEVELRYLFDGFRDRLLASVRHLTRNMEARGGGLKGMEIRRIGTSERETRRDDSGVSGMRIWQRSSVAGGRDLPAKMTIRHWGDGEVEGPRSGRGRQGAQGGQSGDSTGYQLLVEAETADAMGANFLNSVLEALAENLRIEVEQAGAGSLFEPVMAILSNYTPGSRVVCRVEAPVEALEEWVREGSAGRPAGRRAERATPGPLPSLAAGFPRRFVEAVNIARVDLHRAVTHNKGILNGVDALVLATGNDFRAVEACAHAYAARDGQYRGLSTAAVGDGIFSFTLEIPLALGTVGGLTRNHPLARLSLEILGDPSAHELMELAAAAGLASNFSAVASLVTTGIQHGHMRMHLENILRQLGASPREKERIRAWGSERLTLLDTAEAGGHGGLPEGAFSRSRSISYAEVAAYLAEIREDESRT